MPPSMHLRKVMSAASSAPASSGNGPDGLMLSAPPAVRVVPAFRAVGIVVAEGGSVFRHHGYCRPIIDNKYGLDYEILHTACYCFLFGCVDGFGCGRLCRAQYKA